MLKNLFDVFRPLRWYRNGFMVLGSLLAIRLLDIDLSQINYYIPRFLIAFTSICLIASGNYGINEVLDAPFDKFHPEKKKRAIPSGKISSKLVIFLSIVFYIIGMSLTIIYHNYFLTFSVSLLLLSGLVYNINPIRLKDKPYLDFISEAANNPIRLLVGWYAIAQNGQVVPSSFIIGFWLLGIFLMASKRFGEIRFINDKQTSANYRKSLKYYTESNILISMIASLVGFSYMFGALSMKYSIDLILVLPLVVIWTVWFFVIAYQDNTVVKDPERIFEKKGYVIFSLVSLIIFSYLFFTGDQLLGWLK